MNKILKTIVSTICAIMLIESFMIVPALADDDIHVQLNGQELYFDVSPQIINGRIMLPVRTVFESMGATVQWDNNTKTVTATKQITNEYNSHTATVSMTEGASEFYYESDQLRRNSHPMDVPLTNIDGRVLAPLRVVACSLGYCVNWSDDSRTAYIESAEQTAVGDTYSGFGVPNFSSITRQKVIRAENRAFTGSPVYIYGYFDNQKNTMAKDVDKYINFLINEGWQCTDEVQYDDYNTSYFYAKGDTKIVISTDYDKKMNSAIYWGHSYIVDIIITNSDTIPIS